MRILHLANHCNHGHGNAHVAIDLACDQASRGFDVVYASGGGDYEELLSTQGVTVAKVAQNGFNPIRLLAATRSLWALCRDFQPDVVHAHMMSGAVLGWVVSRLAGIPFVTTVHNSFDPHSILMRLGDRVVAVSEAERQLLLRRGYRRNRVKVVVNGPSESARERSRDGGPLLEVSTPCITTVCGLHKRKGVPDLIHAFSRLSSQFPTWHLNIVGQGPDEDALRCLVSALGLEDKVNFLGQVSSSKPILARSDIFVLASYADPCSLAVCEARWAGCAIVATAVGGTPELLGFGGAGRLVPPGSPQDIADELKLLMASPELLATWRERSRSGSGYFRVARLSSDYEQIYRECIAARPKLGDVRYST